MAEFTFFLAVPVMFGLSAIKILKFGLRFIGAELISLVLGMAVAFIASIFVIKFLMNYIKKHDFKVFGWYRIIIGIIVSVCFNVANETHGRGNNAMGALLIKKYLEFFE